MNDREPPATTQREQFDPTGPQWVSLRERVSKWPIMSDFLFARPNFLSGVARIFDFSGSLNQYNGISSPEATDNLAERMDAAANALDGRRAWERVKKTHPARSNHR
jgi:hypothetical protein